MKKVLFTLLTGIILASCSKTSLPNAEKSSASTTPDSSTSAASVPESSRSTPEKSISSVSSTADTKPVLSLAAKDKPKSTETSTYDMNLNNCMAMQTQLADSLKSSQNSKTVSLNDSPNLKIKKYCSENGSILVTCSGLDQKMIVTKSPISGGC